MAKIELVGNEAETAPEVGDFFMDKDTREIYILARVSENEFILICLNDGDRWTNVQNDPSKVFGLNHFDGGIKAFVKIRAPFTITPE